MSDSARIFLHSFLIGIFNLHLHSSQASYSCVTPKTVDYTTQDALCDQPLFFNFLPKTEENMLLDNVCLTGFSLPDDPYTFILYYSFVFCDGSNYVESFVATTSGKGEFMIANPFSTYRAYFVAYTGCNTYVRYRCPLFGDTPPPFVYGTSTDCTPIGLSCLRKVEEVIASSGLPETEFYVLPMKLPNRCVTQQACTLPPNPFYNKLGPYTGLYNGVI